MRRSSCCRVDKIAIVVAGFAFDSRIRLWDEAGG